MSLAQGVSYTIMGLKSGYLLLKCVFLNNGSMLQLMMLACLSRCQVYLNPKSQYASCLEQLRFYIFLFASYVH